MNWRNHGRNASDQVSTDWAYSVHSTARGWTAWQRIPHMRRIGDLYDHEHLAKAACEALAQAQRDDLAPARGVVAGTAMSLAIWALLGLLWWAAR